jgi:natural resistance-associated macrophage protein
MRSRVPDRSDELGCRKSTRATRNSVRGEHPRSRVCGDAALVWAKGACGLSSGRSAPRPVQGTARLVTVVAFIVLGLQVRGSRPFERAIAAMLLIVASGFVYELLRIGPSPGAAVGGMRPTLPSRGGVFAAVGIVGATVMPRSTASGHQGGRVIESGGSA